MRQVLLDSTPLTPSKIVCVGRNYVEHIRELGNETPASPVIFLKPNSAIADEIRCSAEGELHYESEMSFVILQGKIQGVGFGLDLTRRDIQAELKRHGLPWERAKAFDGSAVFSDFVTLSCPLSELGLELRINDVTVQRGQVAQMIHTPERLLEEIGCFLTLEDGDILMTGTPAGVGPVREGDAFSGCIRASARVLAEKRWIARPAR